MAPFVASFICFSSFRSFWCVQRLRSAIFPAFFERGAELERPAPSLYKFPRAGEHRIIMNNLTYLPPLHSPTPPNSFELMTVRTHGQTHAGPAVAPATRRSAHLGTNIKLQKRETAPLVPNAEWLFATCTWAIPGHGCRRAQRLLSDQSWKPHLPLLPIKMSFPFEISVPKFTCHSSLRFCSAAV